MDNKSIKMDANDGTIERTVDRLRNRFDELVVLVGGDDRLAQRLEEIDPFWATIKGYEIVRNAKRRKSGEVSMTRLVDAMEKLHLHSKARDEPQVSKSLSRMGVYVPKYAKTQELQQKMKSLKKS